jgi:hypothetical protein
MKTDDTRDDGNRQDGEIDARLRFALRGLRREQPPQRELWPEIAARIASTPQRTQPFGGSRLLPWALAASLLLAVGIAWRLQPPAPVATPTARLVDREARAMTREYDAALRELQASAPGVGADTQALRELDRSAAQIRSALARDPEARFLIERLRHTYSLRLALTQREALT